LKRALFVFSCVSGILLSVSFAQNHDQQVKQLEWVDPMGRKPLSFAEWTKDHQVGLDLGRIGTVIRTGDDNVVAVVVNAELYPHIATELSQYQADLVTAGYSVQLATMRGMSHELLRTHLAGVTGIVGALFVGELPVAWYEYSDEEFPIDLYFMDLDGTWGDNNGDGLYDYHSGNVGLEIWVGRLYARPLTWDDEVRLTKRYFAKNHAYRTDGLSLPDRALAYVDDDWSWFDSCGLDEAYLSVTMVNNSSTTRASDYRTRLAQGYEWIHICAHSSPWGHTFKYRSNYVGTVFNSEIYAIRPHAHFYNLFCCSGTRYVEENYSAGWDIFQDDFGLLAVGSSKTGSMKRWFDDFYRPMGNGSCVGDAFLDWFAQHGESDPFWHYGLNLLGDPTLKPHGNSTGEYGGEPPPVVRPVNAEVVCTHTETDDSPMLLAMPDGKVWAVWKSGRSSSNGRFDIYASVRSGGSWSSPYSVGPHKYWDTDPVLGLDRNGRPVAVWAGYTSSDHWFDLFYSVWSGNSWSARQRISIDVAADLNPTLARDSTGELWCFWSGRRNLFSDIFAASYNGSTWSTPVNLTNDSMEVVYPKAATMPDGTVWVAYTRDRDGAAGVWARFRQDSSWIETGPVSGEQRRAFRSAIAAGINAQPIVCWQSFETGNGDIYYSEYDGANWSAPALVDGNDALDVMPAMATDSEAKPWVVWMSQRNGNWDIYYSYMSVADWMPAEPVEPNPGPDINPSIGTGQDNMWIAWQNMTSGNWDIYAKSLPFTGCSEGSRPTVSNVTIWPNPFHERLQVNCLSLDRVIIMDAAGRIIRSMPGRKGRVVWDGRNREGCPVSPGVYFIRVVSMSGFQTRPHKVLLIR